jgi:hypothetical protein
MMRPWNDMKSVKALILGTLGSSAILFAVSGCASVEKPPEPYGIEHVVEHAKGDRPVWIDNIQVYQKDHSGGRKYFSGMSIRSFDMEGGRTDAYANALSGIANGMKNTVHNLYISARTVDATGDASSYTADLQKAIEDGTLQKARGVITGASPDLYWWQKYWVQMAPGAPVQSYYNVYVLVSMSQSDYDQSVYQTLNKVQDVVAAPKAHRVIKTMKDLWLKDHSGQNGSAVAPATNPME